MSLTINKKHVKIYALAVADMRAHKFTRVSSDFYAKADAHLKNWMHDYIRQLPSKGKTIK